ncbi:MAG: cyclic nucleotide-binding domain-containing protein [Termitinemataceae bacterium]|nr:MAG: cyclic nucleotide-binding domain-containing protein [Termitinemataceae bacterium]
MADRPQLGVATYGKGTYILIEGKHDADRFYIIREGQIQLSKEAEVVSERGFNTLHSGDFFGVVSAMSQHSQIETALALTDVTALCVPLSEFAGLIQHNTSVAMKIIQQFSRKMRFLNDALTKLTSQAVPMDDPNVLFRIGEYYEKNGQKPNAYYAISRFCECFPNAVYAGEAQKKLPDLLPYKTDNFTPGKSEFVRSYKKGGIVFLEGETGADLFIIQSGSVKITKISNGAEVILALLKPGDIFGEMALLESKPRSASAIAAEDTVMMLVHAENFEGIAAKQPQIIERLTKLLAERIWFSYKQLGNALIHDPVVRAFDNLLINLEKTNVPVSEGKSHIFNFGTEELFKMTGIGTSQTRNVLLKMQENNIFSVVDNKIRISNIYELAKISEYHKKKLLRDKKSGY